MQELGSQQAQTWHLISCCSGMKACALATSCYSSCAAACWGTAILQVSVVAVLLVTE